MGNSAGDAVTTGSTNVGIGIQALSDDQTGSNNTAVGTFSLRDTTVSNNTALGHSAGLGISTGTYNVAIGAFTMDAIGGTGNQNVGIGYTALTDNTTGYQKRCSRF